MKTNPLFFAKLLLSLREKNGWTQTDLGQRLLADRQQVCAWEKGQPMGDEKIRMLAKLAGVDEEYLLTVKVAIRLKAQGIDIGRILTSSEPLESEEEEPIRLLRLKDYDALADWASARGKTKKKGRRGKTSNVVAL